ncbi:MAG: hypothetical protein OXR66_07760 [Candidatus Woesearchaeota archaeon]|nr:hypothetical protein [Candidatus Woesearchaeota archaeon]
MTLGSDVRNTAKLDGQDGSVKATAVLFASLLSVTGAAVVTQTTKAGDAVKRSTGEVVDFLANYSAARNAGYAPNEAFTEAETMSAQTNFDAALARIGTYPTTSVKVNTFSEIQGLKEGGAEDARIHDAFCNPANKGVFEYKGAVPRRSQINCDNPRGAFTLPNIRSAHEDKPTTMRVRLSPKHGNYAPRGR